MQDQLGGISRSERPHPTARRRPLAGWRRAAYVVLAAIIVTVLCRLVLVDVHRVSSVSMEPLLHDGDRILVSRTDFRFGPIRRGDVVIFDGRGSLAPLHSGRGPLTDALRGLGEWLGVTGSDTLFVKRVIGVPGDHVTCCTAAGKLTVNGAPLDEPYLPVDEQPSLTRFDVVVPEGRLWIMGDHRSASEDSRSLLGAPGGGLIPVDAVEGRVIAIAWPPDRIGAP